MNILIVFRNIIFSVCMSTSKRVDEYPCNAVLLSVILHQKEGLNFFDVLVSDCKHIFFKQKSNNVK